MPKKLKLNWIFEKYMAGKGSGRGGSNQRILYTLCEEHGYDLESHNLKITEV